MDTMVIVSVEIGIGIAGLKLLYLWWIVDTIVAVSVEIGTARLKIPLVDCGQWT